MVKVTLAGDGSTRSRGDGTNDLALKERRRVPELVADRRTSYPRNDYDRLKVQLANNSRPRLCGR
jgi:hypothetical protein